MTRSHRPLFVALPLPEKGAAIAATLVLALMCQPDKARAWETYTSLTTADASFLGEADNDKAGESLATAGDVNGDGFGDLLIGAWRKRGQFHESGHAYLVLGSEANWTFGTSLSSANASFVAEDDQAQTGYGLGGGGDVNGDGLDDFLVSAYGFDVDEHRHGLVGLYFGDPAAPWGQLESLTDADVVIQAEEHGNYAGKHLASSGDLDGDGLADILISDYGIGLYPADHGKVYLVFGRTTGWPHHLDLSTADVQFQPDVLGGLDGDVASGGDVNGDGIDDFLLKGEDMVHVFFGRTSGWTELVLLTEADSNLAGDTTSMAMGDVNGDGLADILLGDYWDEEAGDQAGQVWLFLGRTSGWYPGFTPADADASWTGNPEGEHLGRSLALGEDVNGDGLGDILIGAPGYHESDEFGPGAGYLLFGRTAGWANDVPLTEPDVLFVGQTTSDEAGMSAVLADLNGDHLADIVLGSESTDESEGFEGEYLGETYVVFAHHSCTDEDGDGYGDPGTIDCGGDGETDCDDGDPDVNPGEDEDCLDGVDNDCDGDVDGDDSDCPSEDDDDSASDDDTTGDDDDTPDDDTSDDDDTIGPDCRCAIQRTPETPSALALLAALAALFARRRRPSRGTLPARGR
jgi:MYXO-CTERM domain-containing protein